MIELRNEWPLSGGTGAKVEGDVMVECRPVPRRVLRRRKENPSEPVPGREPAGPVFAEPDSQLDPEPAERGAGPDGRDYL